MQPSVSAGWWTQEPLSSPTGMQLAVACIILTSCAAFCGCRLLCHACWAAGPALPACTFAQVLSPLPYPAHPLTWLLPQLGWWWTQQLLRGRPVRRLPSRCVVCVHWVAPGIRAAHCSLALERSRPAFILPTCPAHQDLPCAAPPLCCIADVLMVVAAGNDGQNVQSVDGAPSYPAFFAGDAGMECVLAVAAVASDDRLASFSNYGTRVKIAAPGVVFFLSHCSMQCGASRIIGGASLYCCAAKPCMCALLMGFNQLSI